MSDLLPRLQNALSDQYRIEQTLGRGGMATVFLAEDLKHRRKVALKVLDTRVASAIGRRRFIREIQTVARLTHPHILDLHDSGDADGLLYIVMPYIEGESLRARLAREKQLPLEETLRSATELADALDYAHEHGVVHRDIKPENVLFQHGRALLADFGVARALTVTGDEALTPMGITLGTPAYMSPEQLTGGTVDARSDLYALACVVYEMLAGQPPFTGPTAESVGYQHLNIAPPEVTRLRPAAGAGVTAALRRAMAKAPADRYATTGAFAAALAAGATVPPASQAIDAPVGGRGASLRQTPNWRVLIPIIILALGLAAIAVALFGPRLWGRNAHPTPFQKVWSVVAEFAGPATIRAE